MHNRRYPGVISFTVQQQNIFFGREDDIIQLHNLIRNNKRILLYSKSGIGKSSLLNAGVVPKLQNDYNTINIRFYLYNKEEIVSPVECLQQIINDIAKGTDTNDFDKIITQSKTDKTLWYDFKKLQAADSRKIVLIFDQFEEFFSYPVKMREEFKQQLYEVANIDLPQSIYHYFADNSEKEDIEDHPLLTSNLDVRSVFAIRYDYLSQINELSDVFSDIQENYYELKHLNINQARAAILKPANRDGEYSSRNFEYDADAVDLILKYLINDIAQQIETTQLQIICQKIEDKICDGIITSVSPEDVPDFKNIFLDFYTGAIDKLPETEQKKARILIEDKLISDKKRISLDGKTCIKHISKSSLSQLVDIHLLRAEKNTLGGFNYELSHDTLVEPISEIATKRRQQEENEYKTEEERLKGLTKLKKQKRRFIFISIAAIVILFIVFVLIQKRKLENDIKLVDEAFSKLLPVMATQNRTIYQNFSQAMVIAPNKTKLLFFDARSIKLHTDSICNLLDLSLRNEEANIGVFSEMTEEYKTKIVNSIKDTTQYNSIYKSVIKNFNNIEKYYNEIEENSTLAYKTIFEIRMIESEILNHLYSQIDEDDYKFNKIEAIVKSNSDYVFKGGVYEAKVFIAASDTSMTPLIKLNSKETLNIVEGKGIYRTVCEEVGIKEWGGEILIKHPTSAEIMKFPFNATYSIFEPNLVISPTKMNVFYKGIENPIDISVHGVASKDLIISITNGKILQSSAAYSVFVDSGKETIISVDIKNEDGTTQNLGQKKFRIKFIPTPQANVVIDNVSISNQVSKKELVNGSVVAKLDNFNFDFNFEITEFVLSATIKNYVEEARSSNGNLTAKQKELINKAPIGSKVYFENIHAVGPDERKRKLNSLVFKLK